MCTWIFSEITEGMGRSGATEVSYEKQEGRGYEAVTVSFLDLQWRLPLPFILTMGMGR